MQTQQQTIEQIKEQYPNEWVLVGNPTLEGTVVVGGVVIFHSKDKREIAYSHIDWRANFKSAMTVFTGEQAKNLKFWL